MGVRPRSGIRFKPGFGQPGGRSASPRRALAFGVAAVVLAGCMARRADPGATLFLGDQVYAQRADVGLAADVYRPSGAGPFPAVLLIHGGSWQRGDRHRMTEIGERLARHGYVAVSIDYRLAPEHQFPAQLHDCQAAVRWMRREAARLAIDPERIGAFGYSAGAHLAAMLATTSRADGLDELYDDAPSPRVQAAVLGAAPIDLSRFPENRAMRRLLGSTAAERPDLYARASPVNFVSPDDPPMFLYHGSSDWLVDVSQSRLMLEALDRVRVPAAYFETSGGHFSTFLFDDGPVEHAIAFLDQYLRPTKRAPAVN